MKKVIQKRHRIKKVCKQQSRKQNERLPKNKKSLRNLFVIAGINEKCLKEVYGNENSKVNKYEENII